MFLEQPHRTVRSYAILRESVGKDSFVPGQRLEPYYLSAFAAYRLEFYFRNLRLDPKYKLARYQLLLALRLAATPERPPKPNENAMEKYCEPILEQLWDLEKSDKLLAKATEVITNVSGGKLDRDLLHSEPFTKNVRSAFGLKT
jgi:hypothetical protein